MGYLGVDHGTSAVRFHLLPQGKNFEIPRGTGASGIEEVLKKIGQEVDLAAVTYSMGDGIGRITESGKVHNRGVIEEETGSYVGTGTEVFDRVVEKFPAVVIPGLHSRLEVLDRRFRALYSHMGSSEKVSIAYEAFSTVNQEMEAENLLISDIGSNTVTVAIKDSKLFGGLDACVGAIGLEHGPLDLKAIREVDRGNITANQAFYSGGAVKIHPFDEPEDILGPKNKKAALALETLIMSARMEIFSFLPEVEPHAIVITGRGAEWETVFPSLEGSLGALAPVFRMNRWSAARGSARIAQDIEAGRRDVLGIGVEL